MSSMPTPCSGITSHRRKRAAVQRSATRSCRAFTLIELLVVVAIIGVLSAMILPALGKAKATARKASCLSQLKQWNFALMMFAHDNEDFIPRESFIPGGTTINLWAQVRNPLAHDVWYNTLPEYAHSRRASAYAPEAVRADFYKPGNLFHCPSATFPKGSGVSEVAYFSYAMNSKLILNPFRSIKLGSILEPASTVTFLDNRLENDPKVDEKQEKDNLGQPSAYASRFVTRHGQSGVLAFADGHVDQLSGPEVVQDGWAAFPQTRVIWTVDPGVDPNRTN